MATGKRAAAVLAAASAVTLSACSSSTAHQPATSPPATSAPATAPSTGSAASPAILRAIKVAYRDFFSSTTTVARSQAVLQHGATFHTVLVQESNSPQSSNVQVTVTGARLVSPDTAAVTFTLKAGGVSLPNSQGYAVREGGTWKVAAKTFCSLLEIQGKPPSACSDPAITALPH
jgi:hypothetical protein